MDPRLLAFQQNGAADANTRMSRSVTFPGNVLISGVQTELVIDPGEVQPAGFKYSRAFSLAIPNAELTVVVTRGTEVTDDQGKKAKVLRVNVDHLMTTIFFGSVNA